MIDDKALVSALEAEQHGHKAKLMKTAPDPTRAERLKAELTTRIDTLTAARADRVDWSSLTDVQTRTEAYLKGCAAAGAFPSVLGLCAYGYHVSRAALYSYLSKHPDTATAQYIEMVRDSIADYMCSAGLRNDCNSIMAIFVLKNSHGFTDKVELAPRATPEAEQLNVDDIAARYNIDEH